MGVYRNNFNRWPNGRVPFVCNDAWALKRIEEFNRAVGKTIFITRTGQLNQPNYVDFKIGPAQSNIGMLGGRQVLTYSANSSYSILHEMGHCLGLGHEYFHDAWPHRDLLLGFCPCANLQQMNNCHHFGLGDMRGIHKRAFLESVGLYASFSLCDNTSIMSYPPERLGLNGILFMLPQQLSPGDGALIWHLYPNALPF